MQAGPDILMTAMAARPGAVDKAYIVASSFLMRLEVLLAFVGCHCWRVSCFLLALVGASGLDDEYAGTLNVCGRDFDLILLRKENEFWRDTAL